MFEHNRILMPHRRFIVGRWVNYDNVYLSGKVEWSGNWSLRRRSRFPLWSVATSELAQRETAVMNLTRSLKRGSTGPNVKELHDALVRISNTNWLSGLFSDQEFLKRFESEKAKFRYGAATAKSVQLLQERLRIKAIGELDDATWQQLLRLNKVVANQPILREPGPNEGLVSGRVLDARGVGRNLVPMQLERVHIGGRIEPIARSISGADGTYSFVYPPNTENAIAGQPVHLRVSAGEGEGTTTSPVVINATARVEGLDVILSAKATGDETDFSRIGKLVSETAAKAGIDDPTSIKETPEQPDATLIAVETGLSTAQVAQYVAALKIERDTKGGVPAELAYALGSQGLPFGVGALAEASPVVIEERIKAARDSRIVSDKAVGKVQAALDYATSAHADALTEVVKDTPLGKVIADAVGSELADRLLAIATTTKGREQFEGRLKRDRELEARSPDIVSALDAIALVGVHPPAVKVVTSLRKQGTLVTDLTAVDWEKAFEKAGVDAPHVPDNASEEVRQRARKSYAKLVDRIVEAREPRLYAKARIAASTLPGASEIATFLEAAENYNVVGTRINAYLAEHPEHSKLLSSDDRKTVGALERIAKAAGRITPTLSILLNGLRSCSEIASTGQRAFALAHEDAFDGIEPALRAFDRAQQIAWSSAELWLQARPQPTSQLNTIPLMGALTLQGFPDWGSLFGPEDACACEDCGSMKGPGFYLAVGLLGFCKRAPSRNGGTALDVLCARGRREDLLHTELSCACAKTLVPHIDLAIEILEDAVAPPPILPNSLPPLNYAPSSTDASGGPIPDQLRTQMNTALGLTGTNAAFAISPSATFTAISDPTLTSAPKAWRVDDPLASYGLKADGHNLKLISRSRNTLGTSAERLISPQYLNQAAYETLKISYYPWILPYDRSLTEARVGLGSRNTTLSALREALAPDDPSARRAAITVWSERLGLSPVDRIIVTWATPNPSLGLSRPWEHWGLKTENASPGDPYPEVDGRSGPVEAGTWIDYFGGRLDRLLHHAQIEIEDAFELLGTFYINPPQTAGTRRKIALVSIDANDPATCRTDKLKLDGLDEGALKRIARMRRLSQRSGFALREIDDGMVALGMTELNDAFLYQLSVLAMLRDRLSTSWERLVACFVDESNLALLKRVWTPAGLDRRTDLSGDRTVLAPTLYEIVFRPRRGDEPGLSWFLSDPSSAPNTLLLSSGVDSLAGALGVPSLTITSLLASNRVFPNANPAFNLANLSRLHRCTVVMSGIGLSANDYLTTLELYGSSDPFTSPSALAAFLDFADRISQSSLTAQEIRILRSGGEQQTEQTRTDADITLLEQLRTALARIASEHVFIPSTASSGTPTLDRDGSLLQQRLLALDLNSVLAREATIALSDSTVRSENVGTGLNIDIKIPSVAVNLASLPQTIDLEALVNERASYDAATHKLVAGAQLSDDDLQRLNDASADPTYRQAIAELFSLQASLRGRATYSAETGKLQFTGLMPLLWKDYLKGLDAGNTAWVNSVTKLYNAPRSILELLLLSSVKPTSKQAFDFALPIRLPPEIGGRLFLNRTPGQSMLTLEGVLLPEELARLQSLAAGPGPALEAFRAATRALFETSRTAMTAAVTDRRGQLVASSALAALMDDPIPAENRRLKIIEILSPLAAARRSRDTVVTLLAAALGVSTAVATQLANSPRFAGETNAAALLLLIEPSFVNSPPQMTPTMAAFPAQHKVLRRLRIATIFVNRYALTAKDISTIGLFSSWPALSAFPALTSEAPISASDILRFADYRRLKDRLPRGADSIAAIVSAVAAPGSTSATIANAIGLEIKRASTEVTALASLLGLALPTAAAGEAGLLRMIDALALINLYGLSIETVAALVQDPVSADSGRATIVTYSAGMSSAAWAEAGRAMFDKIRIASRDALVARLIGQGRPPQGGLTPKRWRNAADLFGFFAMDFEIGPCLETSRCRQAISSCQLFIQRCQLGLEPEIDADVSHNDIWQQAQLVSSQQLYTANIEMFLHPQLYIPYSSFDLLDIKSPQLREFEGELGQGEPTPESVTRATLSYLEKLKEIAHLRPVTIAREFTGDGEVLHVVAASEGDPTVHYYRRRETTKVWTPWEKIELELTSSHVLLHIWNRRPFLFWLPSVNRPTGGTTSGTTIAMTTYSDFRLAWSELQNGKWSPQKQSRNVLFSPIAAPTGDRLTFRIAENDDGSLRVCYFDSYTANGTAVFNTAMAIDYPHAEPRGVVGTRLYVSAGAGGNQRYVMNQVGLLMDHPTFWLPDLSGLYVSALESPLRPGVQVTNSGSLADGGTFANRFFIQDNQRSFLISPAVVEGSTGTAILTPEELDQSAALLFDRRVADRLIKEDVPIITDLLDYPVKPGGKQFGPIGSYGSRGALLHIVGNSGNEIEVGSTPMGISSAAEARRNAIRFNWHSGIDTLRFGTQLGNGYISPTLTANDPGIISSVVANDSLSLDTAANLQLLVAQRKLLANVVSILGSEDRRSYVFETFYIPHIDTLTEVLRRGGLSAMLARDVQLRPHAYSPGSIVPPAAGPRSFADIYQSTSLVDWHDAAESLDFDYDSAASVYWFELFFHIHMHAAEKCQSAGNLRNALDYIFRIADPRDQSAGVRLEDGTQVVPGRARVWQTKPFFEYSLPPGGGSPDDAAVERERIERIITVMARKAANLPLSPLEQQDYERFVNQVKEMRRRPFRPHAIARLRPSAYMKAATIKLIELYMLWGEQDLRKDKMDFINSGIQKLLLAAEIAGEAGTVMPPRAVALPQTFASIERGLGEGLNALVEIEGFVAPSAAPPGSGSSPVLTPMMLAFCIPPDDRIQRLRERIALPLFRVRNCMTVDGVKRRLALFDPPIDPALLASAVAAGVDIGAALDEVTGPPSARRARALRISALELLAEASRVSSESDAAKEKLHSTEFELLSLTHQTKALDRLTVIRKRAVDDAEAALAATVARRAEAVEGLRNAARLLGMNDVQEPKEGVPISLLPARSDAKMRQANVFKMITGKINELAASGQQIVSNEAEEQMASLPILASEEMEIALLNLSQEFSIASTVLDVLAGIAHFVPNFHIEPFGIGLEFGGPAVGTALSAAATGTRARSGSAAFGATMAGRAAQLAIRAQDATHSYNLSALRIMQTDKETLVAQIKLDVAQKERDIHLSQVSDAKQLEELKYGSPTGMEYLRRRSRSFGEAAKEFYALAYDEAKAYEREVASKYQLTDLNEIRRGDLREVGATSVAISNLSLGVRRIQRREAELAAGLEFMTYHHSLAQHDPAALARFRASGSMESVITETHLDLSGGAGQYCRQIQGVSFTIPCTTGSFTSVHVRFTLLESTIRISPALRGRNGVYARDSNSNDERFRDFQGLGETVVTSTGQIDSGVFEIAGREDIKQFGEDLGAIFRFRAERQVLLSTWDPTTISDVIVHVRYTARYGGRDFQNTVEQELRDALNLLERPLIRRFSIKHESPDKWARMFSSPVDGFNRLEQVISKDRLPFFTKGRSVKILGIGVALHVRPSRYADLAQKIAGKLTPSGAAESADLTFRSWTGTIILASWSGSEPLVTLDRYPTGDTEPWILQLQRMDPPDTPLAEDALDDIELWVRYELGSR